ncbi:MAG: T9SS type A sorting domain-containing protein [Ignavibacteria bacterium]|nr:T9SS type A sorting domain-containing protein [Ignavibacteria bacterium]
MKTLNKINTAALKVITVIITSTYLFFFTINISFGDDKNSVTNENSFANTDRYNLTIENINNISEKVLEFDIYLLNTNKKTEELKYSLGQYFLEFNPKIANGGNLIYTIVSSDLPEAMRPRNASVSGNQLRLICNSINADKANLPLISSKDKATLIVRMRLETSAKKYANEPIDLNWSDDASKLKTKIFVFENNKNIEITNTGNYKTETDGVTGNGENEITTSLPTEFSLSQNYPNPFNPSTVINYELPSSNFVTLKIYDLVGKEVATLMNEKLDAGRYSAKFNGSNLSSGMYFYKISAGNFTFVKKMVLIK